MILLSKLQHLTVVNTQHYLLENTLITVSRSSLLEKVKGATLVGSDKNDVFFKVKYFYNLRLR